MQKFWLVYVTLATQEHPAGQGHLSGQRHPARQGHLAEQWHPARQGHPRCEACGRMTYSHAGRHQIWAFWVRSAAKQHPLDSATLDTFGGRCFAFLQKFWLVRVPPAVQEHLARQGHSAGYRHPAGAWGRTTPSDAGQAGIPNRLFSVHSGQGGIGLGRYGCIRQYGGIKLSRFSRIRQQPEGGLGFGSFWRIRRIRRVG